ALKKRFPTITHELEGVTRSAVLDGEIVALDETGHPRFEWLVNRGPQRGTLVYYIFDLLRLGDADFRTEPLCNYKRKKLLEKVLKGCSPRLLYVEHIQREGLAMFAGALALGLEGMVAKDRQSPYVEGPAVTSHWQKIKNRDYQRQEKVEFHPRKA